MTHEKEPWKVVSNDIDDSLHFILQTIDSMPIRTTKENLLRIVECVNACAGIEHPNEFIPAMRKEMQDIRDCIDADPNESTYDEVARLKHRIIELNLIKDEIIFLAKKEINNILKKGVTYDNAPIYNTFKDIIGKYSINSGHPENAASPILSGQPMVGNPIECPLPEYETIPVGVVGKDNEILPFIQPEDMIGGEWYIDSEGWLFRFNGIVNNNIMTNETCYTKLKNYNNGYGSIGEINEGLTYRSASTEEVLEYFPKKKGPDHA